MNEIIGLSFRGGERLIIVSAAFVSIWLGYKLFSLVIKDNGSFEGELGQWKIKLQRIAPGIFFAIFGSSILIFALNSPYSFTGPSGSQSSASANTGTDQGLSKTSYGMGFDPMSESGDAFQLLNALAANKTILDKYSKTFSAEDVNFLNGSQAAIGRLKVQLIDVAYGRGSHDHYVNLYKQFLAAGSKTDQFSADDLNKFKSIKQYINPDI